MLIFFAENSVAQSVSAYSDSRNYFYAFDDGNFQQLEYLPVKSYKVSGNSIAYVDNTNEFKIYYDGQSYKQDIYAADFSYYSTGCIVPFQLGRALYVFDRGKRESLSYYATSFAAGDSIMAFYDETSPGLHVYYDHQVVEAEASLLQNPRDVQAGSNLLAYVDQSGYFKIYYHGTVYVLSEYAPASFKAGGDIVAYQDGYDQGFMVFYKGDTARLESFVPAGYKTGYGILAYIDNLNQFKILSNGALTSVSSFPPLSFDVKGNMVVYSLNNQFLAFYDGTESLLENYIPQEYQLSNNGVAYKDVNGRLKFFWKGKIYTASTDVITNYTLEGDVLKYENLPKYPRFFFNGKSY